MPGFINRMKVKSLTKKGRDSYEKREYDSAIRDFDRAIWFDPSHGGSYANRGEAYLRKGVYHEAVEDFSRAIALDPTNSKLYKSRASAYRGLGYGEYAEADIRNYLRRNAIRL